MHLLDSQSASDMHGAHEPFLQTREVQSAFTVQVPFALTQKKLKQLSMRQSEVPAQK
jgi:hypothetical protein